MVSYLVLDLVWVDARYDAKHPKSTCRTFKPSPPPPRMSFLVMTIFLFLLIVATSVHHRHLSLLSFILHIPPHHHHVYMNSALDCFSGPFLLLCCFVCKIYGIYTHIYTRATPHHPTTLPSSRITHLASAPSYFIGLYGFGFPIFPTDLDCGFGSGIGFMCIMTAVIFFFSLSLSLLALQYTYVPQGA